MKIIQKPEIRDFTHSRSLSTNQHRTPPPPPPPTQVIWSTMNGIEKAKSKLDLLNYVDSCAMQYQDFKMKAKFRGGYHVNLRFSTLLECPQLVLGAKYIDT